MLSFAHTFRLACGTSARAAPTRLCSRVVRCARRAPREPRWYASNACVSDTIYALSSGAGVTAGVAIIRVSGPEARHCLSRMLVSDGAGAGHDSSRQTVPKPRFAALRSLFHPISKELLDQALVLYFPGPKSFTGEDVVELHVHGSRAVIVGVVEALGSVKTAVSTVRPAERGEFTRRAFENGRMDLTAVEGLADLIAADTSSQRRQALSQMGGQLREVFEAWREEIKGCLAHAEAVIDFGDDVDDDAFEALVPRVRQLRDEMQTRLKDNRRGEIVRGGARVAIIGAPNAGKSTLLNTLARRPAAIVSPLAGTTRDVVEVQLDLNGLAVIVSDTAGLREHTQDAVELEGMRRARETAAAADVTLFVHDATQPESADALWAKSVPSPNTSSNSKPDHDDESRAEGTKQGTLICVANKMDLVQPDELPTLAESRRSFMDRGSELANCVDYVCPTSLVSGRGVDELIHKLEHIIRDRVEGNVEHDTGPEGPRHTGVPESLEAPVITRARHRHHMEAATAALTSFLKGRTGPDMTLFLPMDLAAEELRIASRELGAITGIIHVEEVLDVIFNDFCIGK